MKYFEAVILLIYCSISITCLDNGLARTPPMGWLAWERFLCNVDCDKDPDNCISENLFMEMAERLVSDGYKDAGYEYVNIDDCWMAPERDKNGDMVPDPIRFPRGIKFLADFMHERGLKLGIYQDFGHHTCMGYPGIVGHMLQDAKKFAEWDIDMLKLDACFSKIDELDWGYITMGKYMKSFGKPILYSCSWPYYQLVNHVDANYELISAHCNLWRNYDDIHDSWSSIDDTINFYGDNQEVISPNIGPGKWSDPDMIMIGNRHLTLGQSRIQMAVWSIIPAPLLMSNDLREISPGAKKIILNKDVIAVNQDYLGISGRRIYKNYGENIDFRRFCVMKANHLSIYKENMVEVWKRKISPISEETYFSYAFLFINKQTSMKAVITFPLCRSDLCYKQRYNATELFGGKSLGEVRGNSSLKIKVHPMDAVLIRLEILP